MRFPRILWIVTDGTAGNFNPAMGLAEAVHARMPCTIVRKDLEARGAARLLPPQLLLRTHYVSLFALQRLYAGEVLLPGEPLPDIVIGNGRVSVPMTVALKRHAVRSNHDLFTIQLQNPCVSPTLFDMVAAPLHDNVSGDNVLQITGALNRITSERLRMSAEQVPDEIKALPRPRIAVLIGGKSRSYMMRFLTAERLTRDVEALRAHHNGSLMVTASRRTEPENLHFLKTAFIRNKDTVFWSGDEPNPYFSYLATADCAVVTEDSVNMISEAATAGLRVLIYPLEGHSDKIIRFHNDMITRGLAKKFTPRSEIDRHGLIFNETDRVADAIVAQLHDRRMPLHP